MTANIPKISVRGIRAALPSGTVLGRLSSGTGATEVIPLSAMALRLSKQAALQSDSAVTSVAGRTGAVILGSSDITDFAAATKSSEETNLSSVLDTVCGNEVGSLLSRGPAGWHVIEPGAAGSILRANGAGAEAAWVPTGLASTVMYLGAGSYAQPVTSGWTLVRLNTIYSDPTSICNTASSLMSVSTAGMYLIGGVLNTNGYTASGATDMGVQVTRGGVLSVYNLCPFTGISSTTAKYFAAGGSLALALNPGDEISLMIYTTAACNVLGDANPTSTSLSLIGPLL